MKHKVIILEKLKLVIEGSNRLALNNLERLINLNNPERLIGNEFISFLDEMKKDKVITSDKKGWYYSITQKGLDFLEKNSEE